jgi:hypothetical protein
MLWIGLAIAAWPCGAACIFAWSFLLTEREALHAMRDVLDVRPMHMLAVFVILPCMTLLTPISAILMRRRRVASMRVMRSAGIGDVLVGDEEEYDVSYVVLTPPGERPRLLLRIERTRREMLLCHDDRDMVQWIPGSMGVRVAWRMGRAELAREVESAGWIGELYPEAWTLASAWRERVLFALSLHARRIQRAWRAWRARMAKRRADAASLITAEVLAYLYRPSGLRSNAARERFEDTVRQSHRERCSF